MKTLSSNIDSKSPLIVWDTCDIDAELEYRLTDESYWQRDTWLEEYKKELGRKNIKTTDLEFQKWINNNRKEDVQQDIWKDADYWDCEWEHLLYSLQEILDHKNPHNRKWRIDVKNMGWCHLSGYKYIDCERSGQHDAQQFLREILPKTDCTFEIYNEGRTLRIVNSHHDAPTGETYICTPYDETENSCDDYGK